ncbi:Protein of unknown function [Pyronema omphalodes CBS 100304]|uniref:Uncharacterized protein n=1 Tax=Pyronema omphalodes (strain CBS 100304) TaxID=1076935 RepID=U4LLN5_PYROM|nr:Protein of unknown function [Pyronema omphalodes CBS 100304]
MFNNSLQNPRFPWLLITYYLARSNGFPMCYFVLQLGHVFGT